MEDESTHQPVDDDPVSELSYTENPDDAAEETDFRGFPEEDHVNRHGRLIQRPARHINVILTDRRNYHEPMEVEAMEPSQYGTNHLRLLPP